MLYIIAITLSALTSRLLVQGQEAPPPVHRRTGGQHEHAHKHGAVASESAVCSKIGIQMLECGGNAADAMVATVLCVGTVAMYHSGIGGGGFMLVRAPEGNLDFIDFRETAPAAAFQDMYKDNINASLIGGLASGVPGELRGLEYLHKHYGNLDWYKLVMPAVHLARNGFEVTPDLVNAMESVDDPEFLTENPTWALDFAPNGTRVGVGDTMTRQRYADTLEQIARKGADAFYTGPIARATIAALQAANGTMTTEDLTNYSVVVREPVQINYRDYKISAGGAPSGGIVAMSALKIIEGYEDFGKETSTNLSTHRLDEAFRFAYGERVNLGDPAFVEGMDEYQQDILAEETISMVRAKISDDRTLNASEYDPQGLGIEATPGTSEIATMDNSGLAVSLTTTVNTLFGSTMMVPETGVILNNEMNDFSVPDESNAFGYAPSPANFVAPGKRPLSSISTVVVDFRANGTLYLTAGAAGGSRIITSTAQVVSGILDSGLTPAEALARPRFHDQLVPDVVEFDYAFDNATVAFMRSRGHNATFVAPGVAAVQAIRRLPNGTFEAASDPNDEAGGAFAI